MGRAEQSQLYLMLAALIAAFGYHIPFFLNTAIGLCLGASVSCLVLFFTDWKKTEREIKQLEEDSKKIDILLEYVKRKPQYDSKIPSSEGLHEQTESSTK